MKLVSHTTMLALSLLLLGSSLTSIVTEIQPKAFLNDVDALKKFVIIYYKKGSPLSTSMLEKYELMAEKLTEYGIGVPFYKFDVTNYKNLAKKHRIRHVPKIAAIFRKSILPASTDENDVDETMAWLIKKFDHPYYEVDSDEELSEFLDDNQRVITYFGDKKAKEFSAFVELCKYHPRVPCVLITDPIMIGTHSNGSKISIFTHYDAGRYDWGSGPMYFHMLTKWSHDHLKPLIEDLEDPKSFDRVFGDQSITLTLFTDSKKKFVREFRKFAKSESKRFQKSISYSIVYVNKKIGRKIA